MNWNILNSMEQIDQIVNDSQNKSVVIFKHSNRCSISSMAKSRFERKYDFGAEVLDVYLIDVIGDRPISLAIADHFDVEHQSPQVLLIDKGQCIYNDSHNGISIDSLKEHVLV